MTTFMIEHPTEKVVTGDPVTEMAPTNLIPRVQYSKTPERQRKYGRSQVIFNGPPLWLRRKRLEEKKQAATTGQQSVRMDANV